MYDGKHRTFKEDGEKGLQELRVEVIPSYTVTREKKCQDIPDSFVITLLSAECHLQKVQELARQEPERIVVAAAAVGREARQRRRSR